MPPHDKQRIKTVYATQSVLKPIQLKPDLSWALLVKVYQSSGLLSVWKLLGKSLSGETRKAKGVSFQKFFWVFIGLMLRSCGHNITTRFSKNSEALFLFASNAYTTKSWIFKSLISELTKVSQKVGYETTFSGSVLCFRLALYKSNRD